MPRQTSKGAKMATTYRTVDILWQGDWAVAMRPAGSDWSDAERLGCYTVERGRRITTAKLQALFPDADLDAVLEAANDGN